MNKKIILASASPRRRELLTQIGLDFDVVVSETEEKITSTEPAKVVEELSAQKAEAVWEKLAVSGVCEPEQKSGETTMTDTLVLGADTVVACDGRSWVSLRIRKLRQPCLLCCRAEDMRYTQA